MGKALETIASNRREHARDWRQSMSNNVAWALLVYTALQIFATVQAMKGLVTGTANLMPYFALIVLVAAIIPACRKFEARWVRLSDEEAHDESLSGAFRRDQILLWLLAIGLPVVLTGLFKLAAAAIG